MNSLPNSFYLVLLFVAIAILIAAYYLALRIVFWISLKKGKNALMQCDYKNALRHLARAEQFWRLNMAKQNLSSYSHDLLVLTEIVDEIKSALIAIGIEHEFKELYEAIQEFKISIECKPVDGMLYSEALKRLQNARLSLRSSLKVNGTRP